MDKNVLNFVNDNGLQNDFEEYFATPYPDEDFYKNQTVLENIEKSSDLDIDFSSATGDFKKSFNKIKTTPDKIESVKATGRPVIVEGNKNNQEIFKTYVKKGISKKKPKQKIKVSTDPRDLHGKGFGVKEKATIFDNSKKKGIGRILVPSDRAVIVEGVNSFILSQGKCENDLKNLNYRCGKKLKELVININNVSPNNFVFELFNPSFPLDYLIANSQNVNNQILVNDSGVTGVQYTDLLFNILANPTRIYNCRMVFNAPTNALLSKQLNENIIVQNKDLRAYQVIKSLNTNTLLDRYQFQKNILNFNLEAELNRPYVPDGMDVMKYTVYAGCSVTIVFYYEQIMLKKYFYKDLRNNKEIL